MLGEQVNLSAGFAQHVTVKINSPLRRETRCAMRCPTRSRSRLSSASVASTRDLSSSLPGCIMHTHIEYTYAVTAQSQERRRGGGRGVSARAGLRHRKCAAAEKDAEDIKKAARAAGSNSAEERYECVVSVWTGAGVSAKQRTATVKRPNRVFASRGTRARPERGDVCKRLRRLSRVGTAQFKSRHNPHEWWLHPHRRTTSSRFRRIRRACGCLIRLTPLPLPTRAVAPRPEERVKNGAVRGGDTEVDVEKKCMRRFDSVPSKIAQLCVEKARRRRRAQCCDGVRLGGLK